MASTWPVRLVFKPVRNVDISIPVYITVRYILAGTGMVLTSLLQRRIYLETREFVFLLTFVLSCSFLLFLLQMGIGFIIFLYSVHYALDHTCMMIFRKYFTKQTEDLVILVLKIKNNK